MRWASAVSEQFSLASAVDEAASQVRADLGDGAPDLAVIFVSPHHGPEFDDLPGMLAKALGAKALIGCSGGGVIGAGTEVEERTGLSVTAAQLPGVDLIPFHVVDGALPDPDAGPTTWEELIGITADKKPQFVVLPDPFSLRADNLLAGLDYAFPGCAKIGGLASGGQQPGANALFIGDAVHRQGAVGVAMHGDVRVDTVVAQGCRPVGDPVVVTKAQRNLLLEADNRPLMEVLRDVFEKSSTRDQQLISRALHLGVVTDPLKDEYKPGDFLIRNVLGLDQESGGLVVGELLREGQLVQFHVRDAQTAAEDLQTMLQQYVAEGRPKSASGALLFSCLGRGQHLFGRPNHDTEMFLKEVGPLPLGGFFCNGEIGRVGPATYLHGFTSSFGIFSPSDA
jgi:small ligand-binding sensory domain FIST